jgi:hypothetical protein
MPDPNNNRGSSVRSIAAELPLRAMRSQLTAASKLCATAENAAAIGEVRFGLDEPNHVPADAVAGVRDQRAALKRKISSLELRLRGRSD